jgi:hypothetical protein
MYRHHQQQAIISKLKQISAKVSTTKMSSQPTIPEPEELVIDGHYDQDGCYCAELNFETIAEVPKENSVMVEIGDQEIPYAKIWNDWVKKDGVQGDIIYRVNDAIYNFIENQVPDLIEMYAKQQFTDYLEDLEKAHTKKQETDITDLVVSILQGGNCDEEDPMVCGNVVDGVAIIGCGGVCYRSQQPETWSYGYWSYCKDCQEEE